MRPTQTMRFTTAEQVTIFLEGVKSGRVPADTMVNIELDLLLQHQKAFQAIGPKLRFRVFWPTTTDRFFATISPRPRHAPANYRTLPPWGVKLSRHGIESEDITCGSGIAPREAGELHLCCSVCGSRETLCIYSANTEMFLGSECEFVRGTRCEYECLQCGSFTTL